MGIFQSKEDKSKQTISQEKEDKSKQTLSQEKEGQLEQIFSQYAEDQLEQIFSQYAEDQLEQIFSQYEENRFKEALENKILENVYPSPYSRVIKTRSTRPKKSALQSGEKIILSAEPIEENNQSKVNAFDERIHISMTAKWPYSVHGVVAFRMNNVSKWGTGIMIGPNIVLTAGHNLYSHRARAYADLESVKFLPGMNGQLLPFGLVEVEKYFISPNYIEEAKEDYGILFLKEPIGEVTGYFGLACLEPEKIKEKRINVTGYPGDKVASKPNTYEMWGMEGEAAHIDKDRGLINYLMNMETTGQSGSGVWYQEGEDYYVCGVHISCNELVNQATLLTRGMYQQIHRWLQEVRFQDLLIKLGEVKELILTEQDVNAVCVLILMKYSLEGLTILDLSWNRMEDEEARILAQNTSWINLSHLHLYYNNICAEGAKGLAQNTSWVNLSRLDLRNNNIGTEGAKGLAQNTSWINLSHLHLGGNNIGAEGAKALAQNTSWINLSQLYLTENNIGAEGAKALAQNISWITLSQLDLSLNNIGAEGAKAFAQNTSWINLSHLNFYYNNIGDEGAKALAQNTSWINLSQLDLSLNNIADEGAKALAQNNSWINLSKLDLASNNISDEGAELLRQNKTWKKDIQIWVIWLST